MNDTKTIPCGCNPCPGPSCRCGCQNGAAPAQQACTCAPQCRCGSACTKRKA